jgi:hypothetical protein
MFENKLPFIAAIVSNFIVVGITYFYFEDYFYLTLMIAGISVLLLSSQFNPWALMASVLLALSAGAFERGDTSTFNLMIILFAIGSILQIAVAMVSNRVSMQITGSTLPLNTLFALLGVGFSYGLIYCIYQTKYHGSLWNEAEATINQIRAMAGNEPTVFTENSVSSATSIGGIAKGWLTIMGCYIYYSLEPYLLYLQSAHRTGTSGSASNLASWNVVAQSIGRIILIGPLTWASLFASINEVRFRIFQFGELFKRFRAGYFSMNRVGCLIFLVLLVLAGGQVAIANFMPENQAIQEYLTLAIITTILMSLSLGTAYSVTRNK